ncbi:flagellar hook-length control protein FliK [Candidatus Marinarcus aquaticus]|uniref:Flagellar hook-length control protein-like C-terminal domain-containing protein n=1 Tax=Candidatus Marinarcus aquaticus TaxID=2044504 RepID=A0A4Q0XU85_9BACT|nr:flagellar hook-length control protein FliK [Candidatus Marinarcus aquaticus]RXJ60084.1 hypothetical protein CRV04_03480 [Candidatus Marinarcus aquaticus]
MEISSNNLLNILLPNDNKVLKEALKQADVEQLLSNNKGGNIQDVLKGLFDDITNNTKSNETVLNILKNTNIFKEMGSFPKELQTLLTTIKNTPSLQKFEGVLEKFMLNITSMNEDNIQKQLNNSGVFLEAKIAKTLGTLPNAIMQTLNEIKTALQQTNLPNKEAILNLIDKIITNQGQNNPTQTLNDIKTLMNTIKDVFTQLQSTQNTPQAQLTQLVTKLETLLNKELPQAFNQPTINTMKPEVASELKNVLTQLQSQVSHTQPTLAKEVTQLLDKLNSATTQNTPLLLAQGKEFLQTLKQLPQIQASLAYNNTSPNEFVQLTQKLEQLLSTLLPSSSITAPLQNQTINSLNTTSLPPIKPEILNEIKTLLTQLQPVVAQLSNIDTKELTALLQKALLPQTQSNPTLLVNTLQELFTHIKSNDSLQNLMQNSMQFKELGQLITKFETLVTKEILNNPIFTNPANNPALLKEGVSHDMKAILLQIQQEINANPTSITNPQDISKQVDRLLTQIDYSQLMSHTSNTNFVYVPFMWNLLEEGTIATMKTDQEKFYCEINLKLKEYGKLNLLLAIYNKNNLDITILAQKEDFKQMIHKNIQELKKQLNSVGLIPLNVKLLDLKEKEEQQKSQSNIFNDYSSELHLGVDIRV